jgi:lipoprotein-anchoring transpeptidase ErfK/SrfK
MVTPNTTQPGTPLRLIGVDPPLMGRAAPEPYVERESTSSGSSGRRTNDRPYVPMPESNARRSYTPQPQANRYSTVQQPQPTQTQSRSSGVSTDAYRESQRADAYDRVQRALLSHREKLAAGDTVGLNGMREDVVKILSDYQYLTGDDTRELLEMTYSDYREEQNDRIGTTRKEAQDTRDATIEANVRITQTRVAGIEAAVRMARTPQEQEAALAQADAVVQEIQASDLDPLQKARLIEGIYSNMPEASLEAQTRFQQYESVVQGQSELAKLQEQWRRGELSASDYNAAVQRYTVRTGATREQLGEQATNLLFEDEERNRVLTTVNDRYQETLRTGQLQTRQINDATDRQTAIDNNRISQANQQVVTAELVQQSAQELRAMNPGQRDAFLRSPAGQTRLMQGAAAQLKAEEEFVGMQSEAESKVMNNLQRIEDIQQEDLSSQLRRPGEVNNVMSILASTNPNIADAFRQANGNADELTPAQRQEVEVAARASRQRQIDLLTQDNLRIRDDVSRYGQRNGIGIGRSIQPQPSMGNAQQPTPTAPTATPRLTQQQPTQDQSIDESLNSIRTSMSGLGQMQAPTVDINRGLTLPESVGSVIPGLVPAAAASNVMRQLRR